MIRLSKRLETAALQVKQGGVVADIGCDHGFTSIYLAQQGLAERVIAADINEGPLQKASAHIARYHMEDKISVRRSDGARGFVPGEADCLLISGMGGALICKILEDSPDVVSMARELVLSPQSEIFLVRQKLHAIHFCIDCEEMIEERGKYYVVIHAVPGEEIYSGREEYVYGRYLIQTGNLVLLSYLEGEKRRMEQILRELESREETVSAKLQKEQLERKLEACLCALDTCKRA